LPPIAEGASLHWRFRGTDQEILASFESYTDVCDLRSGTVGETTQSGLPFVDLLPARSAAGKNARARLSVVAIYIPTPFQCEPGLDQAEPNNFALLAARHFRAKLEDERIGRLTNSPDRCFGSLGFEAR
jgi:hypothetical protein